MERFKFDWFQYTIRGLDEVSEFSLQSDMFADPISTLFRFVPDFFKPWIEELNFVFDKGSNGYTFCLNSSKGFSVSYGNPGNTLQGINFRFSGQALAELLPDYNYDVELASWALTFIDNIFSQGLKMRMTRVDLALDTTVDFSQFVDSFDKGEYRCAARSEIYKVVDSNNRGTIYFGARSGSKMVRVYDKILERRSKLSGDPLHEFEKYLEKSNISSLTRIEIQCRENHSSPAASKALEFMCSDTCEAFLSSVLEFGCFQGYDKWNHPVFIRFDWYETILKFCSICEKVPFVVKSGINFEWLVSSFGALLNTIEFYRPDLLAAIKRQAALSQSFSKRLELYSDQVDSYLNRIDIDNHPIKESEEMKNESL